VRVPAFVPEGHSQRSAEVRCRVSVKFVNESVIPKRETGGLEPCGQGNGGGHVKFNVGIDSIESRLTANSDLTMNDL